jgi:hypothetical protein
VWLGEQSAARAAFERLREHCLAELRGLTEAEPQPPADWTRSADLGCKCPDCKLLAEFLRNPTQQVGRFPLRKDRRQHLHQQIDRHRIDLKHVTDRVGSPQTLVCTKTQASHEQRLKQYRLDCQHLEELESFGSPSPKPGRTRTKRPVKAKGARRGR